MDYAAIKLSTAQRRTHGAFVTSIDGGETIILERYLTGIVK